MNEAIFQEGDIVEVSAIDGRILGRAIVTTVTVAGLLAVEYEEPHEFLFGRRNDIVVAAYCRKVNDPKEPVTER
jgi:hypothetical protein